MTLNRTVFGGQVVGVLPPVRQLKQVLQADQLRPWHDLVQTRLKPRPQVRGHQQRLGTHNTQRLSRYRTLKESAWPVSHHALLQAQLPDLVAREATHWLLHFETGDFLDEQDAWVACRTPVEFCMVALYPDQVLKVDGQRYRLQHGEALCFAPSYRHEVPPATREAAWLGLMLFRNAEEESL